ncbi:spindolin-related protein [Photobacterium aphoticum]|uniref:Spindolin-related protein n=1 Tax=Photobacterium aphoticum TaxID=754436 RepID=A0A090QMF9_9GAMM|nr:spindolin-related protein [Photobacterium aphoticum]
MAHGWADYPKARQVFCEEAGGYWSAANGSGIKNRACRAAFKASGTYQFVQKNEFAAMVPDYNNMAAVKRAVPNGLICSGGDNGKRGMSLPSAHWQRTKMRAGETFTLRYRGTAPHTPSFWQVYITKPGFNAATSTIRWQDLELIASHGNIQPRQDGNGQYFFFDVTLPKGRKGNATLVTRWQRNDPAGEGFYNCSDIRFSGSAGAGGGGTGGVVTPTPLPTPVPVPKPVPLPSYPDGEQNGNHGNAATLSIFGLQDEYRLNRDGHVTIAATVKTRRDYKVEMVLKDRQQRVMDRDSDKVKKGRTALAVLASKPGQYTLTFTATPLKTKEAPTVQTRTVWVRGTSGQKPTLPVVKPTPLPSYPSHDGRYDYAYPTGIGNYVAGETVVLGRDGQTYQCRPFPEGGWCNINSATHYEPGYGSSWQDAWIKL